MRRLIFGAVALVTGLLAAGGIALRRRRGQRDEVLPLDPVPPLASAEAALAAFADEEPGTATVGISPKKPRRRRPRKKPAAGAAAAAADGASDSPAPPAAGATPAASAGGGDVTAARKPRAPSRPKPASSSTEETGASDAS
jgi:hypothetical protein